MFSGCKFYRCYIFTSVLFFTSDEVIDAIYGFLEFKVSLKEGECGKASDCCYIGYK